MLWGAKCHRPFFVDRMPSVLGRAYIRYKTMEYPQKNTKELAFCPQNIEASTYFRAQKEKTDDAFCGQKAERTWVLCGQNKIILE